MNEMTTDKVRAMLAEGATRKRRSVAACALGLLPKKPKRVWTGWVRGQHYWRGRKVILPGGTVGSVYGCVRSKVIVRSDDPFSITGFVDRVYDADDLVVYKVPAAIVLGKGKRGVKERPSAIKARTSRINGCFPPRSQSRPRGRPRKDIYNTQAELLNASPLKPDLPPGGSSSGAIARTNTEDF
jgi:hypothetical protein